MAEAPILSLVTGTVNRRFPFLRLLDSIRRNTDVSWEFIVSDGSDRPIYTDGIRDDKVIIIPEHPRLGYVRGYNKAFAQCTGKYVIWLNDDAEVLNGYANKAVTFMDEHPNVGLGCLAFTDRLWPSEFKVCRYWGMPYANFGIMPREFGNQIGWFWEELNMYGSDNAITFDVILAGKAVAEIRGEFINHHRPDDFNRRRNQLKRHLDVDKLRDRYVPKMAEIQQAYLSQQI